MILAEKGGVKIMSIENGLVSYSMEDLMEIVQAADDGFSFRGPEEQDPLGSLFAEIQTSKLPSETSNQEPLATPSSTDGLLSWELGNPVPQGVELKL